MAGPGIATIIGHCHYYVIWELFTAMAPAGCKKDRAPELSGARCNVQCAGIRAVQITAYAAF